MKYQIFENMINEYLDYDISQSISEVEADSLEEAFQKAKILYPNRSLRVRDGERAIEG